VWIGTTVSKKADNMVEESMDTKKETNTDKQMILVDTMFMDNGRSIKNNFISRSSSSSLLAKIGHTVTRTTETIEMGTKAITIIEMDLKGIEADRIIVREDSTITAVIMDQKVDSKARANIRRATMNSKMNK